MNELIRHVIASKGSHVELIAPDATVADAVAQMNELHIGSLLVIDSDRRLQGIITERDMLVRVLAARRDPVTTRVDEVMTRDLTLVGPDDTVLRAMTLVTERRCRHLPVVEGDRICGVVSAGDLTAWLARERQQTIDDLYLYITR